MGCEFVYAATSAEEPTQHRELAGTFSGRDYRHQSSLFARPRASLTPTLSLAEGEGDGIPLASPLVEACLADRRALEGPRTFL